MDNGLKLLLLLFFVTRISAAPNSLVVSSGDTSASKENVAPEDGPTVPKIYKMHVRSDISNRFSHTTVTSKVKNAADKAQEATFTVVLPETAFITGFTMEVDGKNYTALVKEKEEAKRDYEQALASGLSAGHVAASARDSNRFTVSVNIEPAKKVVFYLTYEELLKRVNGHYEQVVNLHPGQPVQDLSVEVVIAESRKITLLKAPPLRSGNEIGNENAELDPRADIEHVNDTLAVVKFTPNVERQKQLAHLLNTKEDEGLAGQFVVQYDVERDPKGGEVLIQDGYFVHFFAPSDLEPLPKHVVFVLDTSGSMSGKRIEQLKEAMHKILEQLRDKDMFSLVEFNSNVKVLDLDNLENSVWFPRSENSGPCSWQANVQESEISFSYFKFPRAYTANADNIKKAKDAVSKLYATALTDIYSALRVGLHLVEVEKSEGSKNQPMIMFLTDGEPTVRETSNHAITNKITEYNSGNRKSIIFALSFGDGADQKFLQKLALRNSGFNKHIYESADASLQLQNFYNQISSPLLSDVTFKYEPSVTSLTTIEYPIMYDGSELVVAGCFGTSEFKPPIVSALDFRGKVHLEPTIQHSISNIERLWAYLTVKQLLEKKEVSEKDQQELKSKALELALKYFFVTPVTSLIVVKPNATSAVDTEDAAKSAGHFGSGAPGLTYRAGAPGLPGPPGLSDRTGPPGPAVGYAGAHDPIPVRPTYGPGVDPGFAPHLPMPPALSTVPPFLCPPLIFSTEDLEREAPWISAILNEDGSVKLPTGNFKVGLNETFNEDVACSNGFLGGSGHCRLIKKCPNALRYIGSSEMFVKHSCVLKEEFSGVCCNE